MQRPLPQPDDRSRRVAPFASPPSPAEFSDNELLVLYGVAAGGPGDNGAEDDVTFEWLSEECGVVRSDLVIAAIRLIRRRVISERPGRCHDGRATDRLYLTPEQARAIPGATFADAIATFEARRTDWEQGR